MLISYVTICCLFVDPWQDLKEEYGKGGYEKWTALKRSHPHLKVSLAIGGWNEGSKNYSTLVANVQLRQQFVKQVSGFVRKYNFDGLDLDWEYPTQRGGSPSDRENFVALTKELREEFDNHGLLLTSAIGAAKNVIDQAYDVRQISRYLDYLHIMCYDYHGSWDKKIGFNSPLTVSAMDPLSVVGCPLIPHRSDSLTLLTLAAIQHRLSAETGCSTVKAGAGSAILWTHFQDCRPGQRE